MNNPTEDAGQLQCPSLSHLNVHLRPVHPLEDLGLFAQRYDPVDQKEDAHQARENRRPENGPAVSIAESQSYLASPLERTAALQVPHASDHLGPSSRGLRRGGAPAGTDSAAPRPQREREKDVCM